jgi:dienelactone hydrolase
MKILQKVILYTTSVLLLTACAGEGENQTESNSKMDKSEKVDDKPAADKMDDSYDMQVAGTIKGEEVTYQSENTSMKGYIAYNTDMEGKRPGVLVVHEWWGHNDYTRKRADMLAELGFVALAVDMYGNGKQAEHPDDAKKFSGMVMKNQQSAIARFKAAYQRLTEHPMTATDKISAVGYCFGGSVIITMAKSSMPLDAIAAFHTGVETPGNASEASGTQMLIQNGENDPFVSKESVEKFKAQMDDAGVKYEYVEYPNTVHAYTNPDATKMGEKFDLPLEYNEESDRKSWNKMKSFFGQVYPEM